MQNLLFCILNKEIIKITRRKVSRDRKIVLKLNLLLKEEVHVHYRSLFYFIVLQLNLCINIHNLKEMAILWTFQFFSFIMYHIQQKCKIYGKTYLLSYTSFSVYNPYFLKYQFVIIKKKRERRVWCIQVDVRSLYSQYKIIPGFWYTVYPRNGLHSLKDFPANQNAIIFN